jgi:hypothetical protein
MNVFAQRVRVASALAFAGAAATLLLLQIGYSFEAGDQLQYLLLPYRALYANFLPGDWFTWHTSHYHETFAWIVRGIHALCGASGFARGMFVVHVLNLAAFGYALFRLSHALGFGRFEAACCVLVFGLVRQIGLAGAVVNHAGLVPSDLALAPFLLACATFAEGRTLATFAWLGVSGFLHANYAVLGPLTLCPLLMTRCRSRRAVLRFALGCALFALLCAPTLWLVISSFLAHDSAPAAVALTLFVRSPHHYDLAAMRPDQFYYAVVLGLAALPYALGRVGGAQRRRSYLQLMAALSALIGFGFIGSGLHVLPLARLFTWRMSIPLFALWQLAAARALYDYARKRRWLELAWALGLWLLLLCFAQTDPLEASPWNSLPRAAALAAALLAISGVLALWPLQRAATVRRGAAALASVLALGVGLSVTHSRYWQGAQFVAPRGLHLLDGPIALTTAPRPLYTAIRERTPADARFLAPPGHSQFRLQARRALFVDWKCAPMKGAEALEWQRRMLAAMGATSFPAVGYELPRAADAAYAAQPLEALAQLARRENLTHVLVRSDERPPPPSLRRLFTSGAYVVYAVVQP